jgi:hypothetical protein
MRQIEKMLKSLMLDYNAGHIIQMSFDNKIMLKGKLVDALSSRDKLADIHVAPH